MVPGFEHVTAPPTQREVANAHEFVDMPPKPPFWSIARSGLFLLLFSAVASAGDDGLRERLEGLRSQSNPALVEVPVASARLLDDFYRRRYYRYVWHNAGRILDLLFLAEHSVDKGHVPLNQTVMPVIGIRIEGHIRLYVEFR